MLNVMADWCNGEQLRAAAVRRQQKGAWEPDMLCCQAAGMGATEGKSGRQLWATGSPAQILHESTYLLFHIMDMSNFSNV